MQTLIIASFFIELIVLYFISVRFIQSFGAFIFHLTHSHKIVVYALAFLFLPGTLIHEIAHAITAKLLLVYVGKIELRPEAHEGGIKLGSAEIGKTDPLRRMLIGFAPVFWGIGLLFGIIYLAFNLIFIQHLHFSYLIIFLIAYIIFVIANTMFSSKKDMEGTLEALAIITLISLGMYYTGAYHLFIFGSKFINFGQVFQTIKTMELFLVVPIVLDLVLWGIFKVLV